jgi:phosphoribosylglycinamide formyltransferase-1
MRIACFASGSGSNFAAVQEAIKANRLSQVEIVLLVCDRPGAFVITRAEQESIPVFSFQAKDYEQKSDYEVLIVEQLKEKQVDLIVLVGYMRIVGDTLLNQFEGRIINLHPSLLPSFSGKDAIGQALDYGVKLTGITVHFVDAGMDTGPIIAQRSVVIEDKDTRETLTEKIQQQEHILLPEVIGWFAQQKVHLQGRHVSLGESEARRR